MRPVPLLDDFPVGGTKHWYVSTIRRIIENDISLPYEEVAEVLSPEVASALDPERRYSLYWFNRKRVKRLHTGTKAYSVTENDPSS